MRVHDSQAYMKVDVTSDRNSLILCLLVMVFSFQIVFSFVSADVACAILARISFLEPSSVMIDPRYLKLVTGSSFSEPILISALKPSVLLVMTFVFSVLM